MKLNNSWSGKIRWQVPGEGAPATEADAGPDLSFIPTDFVADGKPDLGKFSQHYQDLVAADAQRREAMANVPEDGAYDFALPADLKFDGLDLPEGFTVDLDPSNEAFAPLFAEFGEMLKEIGAPRDAAQKASGLLAKYEAAKFAQAIQAQQAEIAKLGTPSQASARMAAIQRKIEATLPAEQAAALKGLATSAAAVQALEKLLAPRNVASPVAQPNSAANLEGLSPFERLKAINAAQMKSA